MSDRKIRRLPSSDERWLWIAVMSAASESPVRGHLLVADGVPITCSDLADMAQLPEPDVARAMRLFEELGLVKLDGATWWLPRWSVRQPASDGTSTERSRRHRERARSNDATLQQRPGTGTESESDPELDPSSVLQTGSPRGAPRPSTDDDTSGSNAERVELVARRVAELRLERQQKRPSSVTRWMRTTTRNLRTDEGGAWWRRLEELVATHQDDTPLDLLAHAADGTPSRTLAHWRTPREDIA
jgi:hypothetical protein